MNASIPEANPSLNTLGQRLKATRSAWAWSQEEMATTLCVDQASISFWERDRIVPSGSAMVALAALFRTSQEALKTGEGFVLPTPPSKPARRREDRKSLRFLALPASDPEQIALVDLREGCTRIQTTADTAAQLDEALKAGRRAWVILE